MADHEATRREYVDRLHSCVGDVESTLRRPPDVRRAAVDEQLGSFLEFVRSRSDWHRDRLGGLDIGAVSSSDMSSLPTMGKRDLHDHWDEIVTDPELTLDRANRHLDSLVRDGFGFALGRYVITATGGSTGFRSVIACDVDAWAYGTAGFMAPTKDSRPPSNDTRPVVQGRLAAQSAIHASGTVAAITGGSVVDYVQVTPSMPISHGVELLNEARPTALVGYPSLLHLMALEQLAGRLNISPTSVTSAGEPLQLETRAIVLDAFGIETQNNYGSSEGFFGMSWRGSQLLNLTHDTTIVELVDADNRPVPPGTRAAKLLITNLANRLQPLIRYQITDEVTEAVIDRDSDDPTLNPPGPWTGRWIHPPQGRNDDWFDYDGIVVHPHIFRSQLSAVPEIAEYQVTQTKAGADIDVVVTHAIDCSAIGAAVAGELGRLGLDNPDVRIEVVDAIRRHPDSGKLRRFIPI